MKWFKHYTNAHKGGVLQHLSNDFSINEAYALYFRFVEYLSDKWDGCSEPKFTVNERELKKFLTVSQRKFDCFLIVMQKQLHIEFTKNRKLVDISFPKLLEVLHKDALSSKDRPASGPPDSRLDKKKKKSNTTVLDFLNLESLLVAIPKETQDGWKKLYAKEFIDRELIKAWNYYLDDKPKALRGWSRVLSGWLERTHKWDKRDASKKGPDTGGWEHTDGVS